MLTLTLNASTPSTHLFVCMVSFRSLQCLGSCLVHPTCVPTMYICLTQQAHIPHGSHASLRQFHMFRHVHLFADTGLSGVVVNVTDNLRSKLQLVQLTGTALQMPCATPGMFCGTAACFYAATVLECPDAARSTCCTLFQLFVALLRCPSP